MNTQSNILETIGKLLALANNDGATEGEVKAALNRVAHLAQKHNVSDIEIERAQRADGSHGVRIRVVVGDLVDEIAYRAKNLTRWDKWLGCAVADASTTGVYLSWSSGQRVIRFYGLPQDVAVARALFDYARAAMTRCARKWAKGQREDGRPYVQGGGVEVRTYKDGFCAGLCDATKAQRAAARTNRIERLEAPADGGTCTAVVLVADVQEAKETALVAKGTALGLKKARRTGARSWGGQDAYGAGRAAGASTSLSRGTID